MARKEIKLPSGAILRIQPAPFAHAKALNQALLAEFRTHIRLDSAVAALTAEVAQDLLKDLFCIGFSSPTIEACIWQCLQRCTYDAGKGESKVDQDTFEPVEARQDFIQVCFEVCKENCGPFVNSLYAQLSSVLATTGTTLA